MDETLQLLERRTREAPDDEDGRIRFATALARVGRRREAIEALDLAKVSDDALDRARSVTESAWRDELAVLRLIACRPVRARVTDLVLEAAGRWFAIVIRRGQYLVADRAGELLHTSKTLLSGRPVWVRGGLLVSEHGGDLVLLEPGWKRFVRRVVATATRMTVVDASPEGDRILVADGNAPRVLAWPDMTVLAEATWETRRFPFVDWTEGKLIARSGSGIAVTEIGTGRTQLSPFGITRSEAFALGGGIVAKVACGGTLHSPRHGWTTRLLGTRKTCARPSLAHDGRTLRHSVGSQPWQARLDLATGRLTRLDDRPLLEPTPLDTWATWHPHASVYVGFARGLAGGVATADRELLCEVNVPPACARWSRDGRTLVLAPAGGRAPVVYVWSTA